MSDAKTYHEYVFDADKSEFLGRFEDMYRAEQQYGFDSWHQDDLTNLTKRLCLAVLASYNFTRILDIGSGKGAFTQQLVRKNNQVVGIDVSDTALSVARGRCPEVSFIQADLNTPGADLAAIAGSGFDLAVSLETLSYLERWSEILDQLAVVSRHALISLYLPDEPIGFIKSFGDLATAFARAFTPIEEIRVTSRRQIILFGESRLALHQAPR